MSYNDSLYYLRVLAVVLRADATVERGRIVEFVSRDSIGAAEGPSLVQRWLRGELAGRNVAVIERDVAYDFISGRHYVPGRAPLEFTLKVEDCVVSAGKAMALVRRCTRPWYTVGYHWGQNGVETVVVWGVMSCECISGCSGEEERGGGIGSGSGGGNIGDDGYKRPVTPIGPKEIDPTALDPCFRSVYDDLSPTQSRTMRIFTPEGLNYDWKLQMGQLPAFVNGRTDIPADRRQATTTFDPEKFRAASELSIARTIIHESVHAYLFIYFRNNRSGFVADNAAMLAEWVRTGRPNDDHVDFARYFRTTIADDLEAFGRTRGLDIPRQFYEDMAWGGLQSTPEFRNLPQSEQERISNVIHTEQYGRTTNGTPASPKGRKSYCSTPQQ